VSMSVHFFMRECTFRKDRGGPFGHALPNVGQGAKGSDLSKCLCLMRMSLKEPQKDTLAAFFVRLFCV
jgi:hypothetical protein